MIIIEIIFTFGAITAIIFILAVIINYFLDKNHAIKEGQLPITFKQFYALYCIAPDKWKVFLSYEWLNSITYGPCAIYDGKQEFYFKGFNSWRKAHNFIDNQEKEKKNLAQTKQMQKMVECWKKDIENCAKNADDIIKKEFEKVEEIEE